MDFFNFIPKILGITSQTSRPPSELHKFSKLPPEIRLQIWNLAHDEVTHRGRIIEVRPRGSLSTEQALPFTIQTSSTPDVLLRVNQEARNELLRQYLTPFSTSLKIVNSDGSPSTLELGSLLLNPANDTIFLHGGEWRYGRITNLSEVLDILFGSQKEAVASNLRSLVVPRYRYSRFSFGEEQLPGALPGRDDIRRIFPKLRWLAVRYNTTEQDVWKMRVVEILQGVVQDLDCSPELMLCDLDSKEAAVEPWFLTERHGWRKGFIRRRESRT
jgi:hypothetical protein